MKYRKKMCIYLLSGVLFCGLIAGCSSKSEQEETSKIETQQDIDTSDYAERDIFAMDTYMTVTAYGDRAEEAVDAAEQEIDRLDSLLSTANSESEIYIVNENGSEILSEDTALLLEKSLELYDSTNGLFDITVYPLMQEWGFTTEKYKVPKSKRIEELLQNVDASKIEFETTEQLLTLPEGVKIDLGGIAKGYTSGRIMEIFKEYGIQSGIVSLGGNVQTYGSKPDGSFWKVAVQNPDILSDSSEYIGVLEIKDKAVITSGGYERYFEEDNQIYHHILNPKTGYPADLGLSSVTIVSADGMLADGLSTSLFVMGKKKALNYWREYSDLFDAILVENDGAITITEGLEEAFSSDFDVTVEYR